MFGGSRSYGPKIIMDRNIIFVNFNYRLGPLGFLSTEDNVVPGNMGMKDQVMALRWVKNNIQFFGGNPNSITLTGMSAGGASVHLHYMSPMSTGNGEFEKFTHLLTFNFLRSVQSRFLLKRYRSESMGYHRKLLTKINETRPVGRLRNIQHKRHGRLHATPSGFPNSSKC